MSEIKVKFDGRNVGKLPPGGTTGQVPAKASNENYDIEWVDQTGEGGGTATAQGYINAFVYVQDGSLTDNTFPLAAAAGFNLQNLIYFYDGVHDGMIVRGGGGSPGTMHTVQPAERDVYFSREWIVIPSQEAEDYSLEISRPRKWWVGEDNGTKLPHDIVESYVTETISEGNLAVVEGHNIFVDATDDITIDLGNPSYLFTKNLSATLITRIDNDDTKTVTLIGTVDGVVNPEVKPGDRLYIVSDENTFYDLNQNFPIDNLSNVNISSPTTGQVLTYDSGEWVNADSSVGSSGSIITARIATDYDDAAAFEADWAAWSTGYFSDGQKMIVNYADGNSAMWTFVDADNTFTDETLITIPGNLNTLVIATIYVIETVGIEAPYFRIIDYIDGTDISLCPLPASPSQQIQTYPFGAKSSATVSSIFGSHPDGQYFWINPGTPAYSGIVTKSNSGAAYAYGTTDPKGRMVYVEEYFDDTDDTTTYDQVFILVSEMTEDQVWVRLTGESGGGEEATGYIQASLGGIQAVDADDFIDNFNAIPPQFLPTGIRLIVEYDDGNAAIWTRNSTVYTDPGPYYENEEIITVVENAAKLVVAASSISDQGYFERVISTSNGTDFFLAAQGINSTVEAIIDSELGDNGSNLSTTISNTITVSEAYTDDLVEVLEPKHIALKAALWMVDSDPILDGSSMRPQKFMYEYMGDGDIGLVMNATTPGLNGLWQFYDGMPAVRPGDGTEISPGAGMTVGEFKNQTKHRLVTSPTGTPGILWSVQHLNTYDDPEGDPGNNLFETWACSFVSGRLSGSWLVGENTRIPNWVATCQISAAVSEDLVIVLDDSNSYIDLVMFLDATGSVKIVNSSLDEDEPVAYFKGEDHPGVQMSAIRSENGLSVYREEQKNLKIWNDYTRYVFPEQVLYEGNLYQVNDTASGEDPGVPTIGDTPDTSTEWDLLFGAGDVTTIEVSSDDQISIANYEPHLGNRSILGQLRGISDQFAIERTPPARQGMIEDDVLAANIGYVVCQGDDNSNDITIDISVLDDTYGKKVIFDNVGTTFDVIIDAVCSGITNPVIPPQGSLTLWTDSVYGNRIISKTY